VATRSTAHAGEEKAIFDAFVAAHPSFGAQIKNVEQPDAEFPDVIVELKNGTFIDFELGEWLHGARMAAAKQYDAFAKAIGHAIADLVLGRDTRVALDAFAPGRFAGVRE